MHAVRGVHPAGPAGGPPPGSFDGPARVASPAGPVRGAHTACLVYRKPPHMVSRRWLRGLRGPPNSGKAFRDGFRGVQVGILRERPSPEYCKMTSLVCRRRRCCWRGHGSRRAGGASSATAQRARHVRAAATSWVGWWWTLPFTAFPAVWHLPAKNKTGRNVRKPLFKQRGMLASFVGRTDVDARWYACRAPDAAALSVSCARPRVGIRSWPCDFEAPGGAVKHFFAVVQRWILRSTVNPAVGRSNNNIRGSVRTPA
eukprot:gene25681-biopygen3012